MEHRRVRARPGAGRPRAAPIAGSSCCGTAAASTTAGRCTRWPSASPTTASWRCRPTGAREAADGGRADLLGAWRHARAPRRAARPRPRLDRRGRLVAGRHRGRSAWPLHSAALGGRAGRRRAGRPGRRAPASATRSPAQPLPRRFPSGDGPLPASIWSTAHDDPLSTPDLVAGLELRLRAAGWTTRMHAVDARPRRGRRHPVRRPAASATCRRRPGGPRPRPARSPTSSCRRLLLLGRDEADRRPVGLLELGGAVVDQPVADAHRDRRHRERDDRDVGEDPLVELGDALEPQRVGQRAEDGVEARPEPRGADAGVVLRRSPAGRTRAWPASIGNGRRAA